VSDALRGILKILENLELRIFLGIFQFVWLTGPAILMYCNSLIIPLNYSAFV